MRAPSSVKRAWAAPAEIVYYMFEDPLWFLDMGLKGAPLLLAGTCIVWFVNVMIIVSTFTFCIESVDTFSADPKVNPGGKEDAEFWEMAWLLIEVSCVFVFTDLDELLNFLNYSLVARTLPNYFELLK